MSNISPQTCDNFYRVVNKIALDYSVEPYLIEDSLLLAIDRNKLKPVNYSFNQLLDIWYRDCQFSLDHHFYDIGLAA